MAVFANISSKIIQSEIRTMSIECSKVHGINLSQGFSDTDINKVISEGAKRAIDNGTNHYTRYDGLPELRTAISKKLERYNGISADPETEIIVTSGSTAALFCVLFALCKPKDEVILFEPYYGYHLNTLFAVNLTPKYVTLRPPEWKINIEELEKQISHKTKAIVLNTPTNPSGKIFSKKEILLIGAVARKHNLMIITDEIYEYFLYDNAKHVSPGSLRELKDITITISGYSKTYSITGWRIGYIACPADIAQVIGYVHDLIYVCAPAPLQMGVVAGIEKLGDEFYENLRQMYHRKRDILCSALATAGLTPIIPQGAYYVLADISKLHGTTSKARVMELLRQTKVAAVPGMAFYHGSAGESIARFCFAKRDEILEEAAQRIASLRL